jgi:FkbH-like protein
MILRDDDFVSMKINWNEKYQNIKIISNQLGIDLSDIVFLDDNPIEREKVKKLLPQVMTIDLPSTPLNYVEYLSSLNCFDLFTFSNEDRKRTKLYKMKKEKEDNKLNLKESEKVFFESKIVIEKFNKNNLLRISQLINKTNQFNLKTRRMTVIELSEWVSLKENFLWSYRVLDKFGDHGLTGIGSFTINGQDIIVEDFVLSCRVLGYGIENAILCHLIKESRKLNKQNLIIELLKTEKNDPIEKFLNQSDLFKVNNNSYLWDLNKDIRFPKTIQII